jgi:hypothetical protein
MLTKIDQHKIYRAICNALLALVLIGLPLTSFPPLRNFSGSLVAPFSAIPLAILIAIWLIPYLIRKGIFPKEVSPILYFVLAAIFTSALAFFLDGFYARGKDFFGQSIRALITLGIGLSFYITLSAYIQNKKTVQIFLLFLYICGVWIIAWSFFEIILLRVYGSTAYFPGWVTSLRSALSFQRAGMRYSIRLTGFAYEPSWFVLIFDLVLFPIWLASVFLRKSLFKVRLWVFQAEDLLLLLGIITFAFSFPRIGLLALVVMLAYLGIIIVKRIHHALVNWFSHRKMFKGKDIKLINPLLAVILIIFILVIVTGTVLLFFKIAGQRDYRYQLILDQIFSGNFTDLPFSETGIILLARRLAFYERTIYWFGGWNIFADHPFGVGLGNAGFYFVDNMNSLGYESYEIRNLLFQTDIILNTKSLWFRLLAETGLVGFSLYMTWIYLLWRSSSFIQKSRDSLMQIVGLAGKFFILAYLVEGFSVDSFALPYQWIIAGLITASRLIVQREGSTLPESSNAA